MYGKDIGTLNVYLKKGNNKLPGARLWTRTGDRGNVWRVAQVTVSSATGYNVRGGKHVGARVAPPFSLNFLGFLKKIMPLDYSS